MQEAQAPVACPHLVFCEPRPRTRAAQSGPSGHLCETRIQPNRPISRGEIPLAEPFVRLDPRRGAQEPKRRSSRWNKLSVSKGRCLPLKRNDGQIGLELE